MPAAQQPLQVERRHCDAAPAAWHASLRLEYARQPQSRRSYLARNAHLGPLTVQKALYPEGEEVCHTLIVHPPGGIASIDQLNIDIGLQPHAHACITTPGASKWYRSNGTTAAQCVEIDVAQGAVIEWLPHEAIVYSGARARMQTRVRLAKDACYLGWEVTCLGRTAAGERFDTGYLRQITEIFSDDALLWNERCVLEGQSPLLGSAFGLAGMPVGGIMIAAGKDLAANVLADCRLHQAAAPDRVAVTVMPRLLIARYLGRSAQEARRYFTAIWRVLRPHLAGRAAVMPRIWST